GHRVGGGDAAGVAAGADAVHVEPGADLGLLHGAPDRRADGDRPLSRHDPVVRADHHRACRADGADAADRHAVRRLRQRAQRHGRVRRDPVRPARPFPAPARLSADQPGHRPPSRQARRGLVPPGADDFRPRLLGIHPAAVVGDALRDLPRAGAVAGCEAAPRPRRRRGHLGATAMNEADVKQMVDGKISRERAKELLIELVKVPSPQTGLPGDGPLLKAFTRSAVEPRLRAMGFANIRYDAMGNLIATYGAGASGRSLMLIGNAMNQPAATMRNAYAGDVVDGAPYGLPGECVMGKGASEQKANLAAMLHAMEIVIASGVPIAGRLVFVCCLSGETGKH